MGGELPTAVSSLINLDILDLSQNSFIGSLPSLKNLTKLRELNLNNNNFVFNVSSFPPSPLQKLDLGTFGTGFGGLPILPSSYNFSLLTLSLRSNGIVENIPFRYFDRFEKLQAVFLQNNKISGDLSPIIEIPRGNDIEFINLSKNNLSLGYDSLSSIGINLDLSYNPLCQKTKDPNILKFCPPSNNLPSSYSSPSICNISCTDGTKPNPYTFESTNKCTCSRFLLVQITFSPSPLSYISNRCVRGLEDWVSGMVGINSPQAQVTSANFSSSSLPSSLSFYLRLFGSETEAPGSEILVSFFDLEGLEAPSLGFVDFISLLPVPYDTSAAQNSAKGGKSNVLNPLIIAVIVIIGSLFFFILFLVLCLHFRRKSEPLDDENPMLPQSTFVEGERQFVQYRAET